MTRIHTVGSLFRFAGFLFLIAAVIPVMRGDGLNAPILVIGLAFFVIGIVVGLKARSGKARRPSV